ncbi:MAG TPA: TPM domain-containing protein [Myxococcota bacterium]|nr:TPM domain-containing protein [Myxococcota bacterium]
MPRRYLTRAQAHKVKAAIGAAERGHRGEIQVFLEGRFPGDGPLSRARQLFFELGLDRTREGTGVLLYAAIDDRRSAIWAGPGLYAATAPDFWLEVTRLMAQGFGSGDVAGGLERALAAIGRLLTEVAPGEDTHGNELRDQVHER